MAHSLLVMKFGGTNMQDAAAIRHSASLAARSIREGVKVVVVVSAMAGVTNQLLRLADSAHRAPTLAGTLKGVATSVATSWSTRYGQFIVERGCARLLRSRRPPGRKIPTPILTESRRPECRRP